MQPIGVLGGTFDPVHCGHLRLALEVRRALDLSVVHLIPAARPPHRAVPAADAATRLEMLHAATRGMTDLCADDRELRRAGPSYTVETLESFRRAAPESSLCLVLGMDAFCELDTWYRWEALANLAHIAVAHRPGAVPPASGAVGTLLASRRTEDSRRLHDRTAGCIFLCEIPSLEISATRVRSLIAGGHSPRCLVPDGVLEIITREGLYSDAK